MARRYCTESNCSGVAEISHWHSTTVNMMINNEQQKVMEHTGKCTECEATVVEFDYPETFAQVKDIASIEHTDVPVSLAVASKKKCLWTGQPPSKPGSLQTINIDDRDSLDIRYTGKTYRPTGCSTTGCTHTAKHAGQCSIHEVNGKRRKL